MSRATEPMTRQSSTAGSVVSVPTPLRHPTPDSQSLQGVYLKNIEKLERSAEKMSENGSDIGEEIRRLSRQSSLQSSKNGDISVVRPSLVDRMDSNRSTRSGSNGRNIVDINGAARWGGYSPGGYITSPVGSVSGSWSHTSLSRVASGTKSSRLAQVNEPMQEDWPLNSPLGTSFVPHEEEPEQEHEYEHSRDPSQSSFARHYDEIAGQIEESLEHVPPSPTKDTTEWRRREALQHLEVGGTRAVTPPSRPRSTDTYREAQTAFQDFDGVHFSPDTDEFVEVDQDGNEIRRVSARSVSGGLSSKAASILRTPRAQPIPQAAPPPEDGMVYYPAPVPKMLNLPKRLSQLPAASVQAKRRTQVLDQLPAEARAGAPWLSQENVNVAEGPRQSSGHSRGSGSSGTIAKSFLNERMSANMSNLPPQLRANMFFEHQPVRHDVEVKSESAVATLDSILAASATAPVNAFMDHPFAGDVRKSVYSLEKTARRSTATIGTIGTKSSNSPEQKKAKQRRSSIGSLLKRTSSSDEIASVLNKRGSRVSFASDLDFKEGGNKLRKRRSQLSLGDELERDGESGGMRTPADEINEPELRSGLVSAAQNATVHDGDRRVSRAPTVGSSGYKLDDDADQIKADFKEVEEQEDVEDGETLFVQPSTLLAELQVRKAQQKSRNKTAAVAFPNGMHSTLLQLDAVEEINKRKRQNQRIALAWEDPHQRALDADVDKDDEDVPLGMLFPAKDGKTTRKLDDGRDWDRPLGLMERRELEDNEPLSRRRNRLRGPSPAKGRDPSPNKRAPANDPQPVTAQVEVEAEDEDEGETLAQRLKRLRTKDALDTAISDVAPKDGERPVSTFTDDVLGQLGDMDGKKTEESSPNPQGKAEASPQPEEEETLGQRRARLQREREASGEHRNVSDGSAAARPPIVRSQSSLANLLASNPVGQRAAAKNYQPGQGSLLHANAQAEARQKNALLSTNKRSSSYHLEKPLVDSRPYTSGQPNPGGLLSQQYNSRAAAGGFAAGTYNNGMGGIQLQTSASTPMYTGMSNGANGYFASPYGGYASPVMGYPQQMQMMQQPMGFPGVANPYAYNTLGGGAMGGYSNTFIPQTMGSGTYASYAQNMGGLPYGAPGMAMGMADEGLDPNQRAAIDNWRLGVAPQ